MKWHDSRQIELVFATGSPGGWYEPIAESLKKVLEKDNPSWKVKIVQSAGSGENVRLLEAPIAGIHADFALIQNDIMIGTDLRSIAQVSTEVLHFLRHEKVEFNNLTDIEGKRIAIGQPGSGTLQLVEHLFSHYGIRTNQFTPVYDSASVAVTNLIAGRIDAMLFVSILRNTASETAISSGQVKFVSLGEASKVGGSIDGFQINYPFIQPFVIPEHVYPVPDLGHLGEPDQAIGTVAVPAMLVCRKDLPERIAYLIAQTMFSNRAELIRHDLALSKMNQPKNDGSLQFPVHKGADGYYRRNEPGFLVRYAESMAFFLSAALALWGLGAGLRSFMQRTKKDRLDIYYLAVEQIMFELSEGKATDSRLTEMNKELIRMRHKSVNELVKEKLVADDSFRIYQTMLSDCQQMVDKALSK